jgi:hypothetical protein
LRCSILCPDEKCSYPNSPKFNCFSRDSEPTVPKFRVAAWAPAPGRSHGPTGQAPTRSRTLNPDENVELCQWTLKVHDWNWLRECYSSYYGDTSGIPTVTMLWYGTDINGHKPVCTSGWLRGSYSLPQVCTRYILFTSSMHRY